MFSWVNWEIVRKTSLMSASFRSSEIGSPVNCPCDSEIVRGWYELAGGAALSGRAPSSCCRTAAAASNRASSRLLPLGCAGARFACLGEAVWTAADAGTAGFSAGGWIAGEDAGGAAAEAGAGAGGAGEGFSATAGAGADGSTTGDLSAVCSMAGGAGFTLTAEDGADGSGAG